jgi:hypothetical protein
MQARLFKKQLKAFVASVDYRSSSVANRASRSSMRRIAASYKSLSLFRGVSQWHSASSLSARLQQPGTRNRPPETFLALTQWQDFMGKSQREFYRG